MADREFKVNITGDASGLISASKEGESALSKVGTVSSENASALQDELNPAVESFKKTWKSTAKETEEFAKKGELKHMVRELKMDFPILGLVAKAALNPLVGGFTILLGILKGVHEVFKGMIEASNTGIFSGSFRQSMDEARKAAMEGELAFRAYQRALQGVADAHGAVAQKTKDSTEAMRQHAVAVAEQSNANKAMEISRVNMLEQEGKISGPEAIKRRLGIEDKYGKLKLEADVEAKEKELAAKRSQQHELDRSAGFEEINAEQARKDKEESENRLKSFDTMRESTKKALEETKKQMKALEGEKFMQPGWQVQYTTAKNLRDQLEQRLLGMSDEDRLELADQAKAAAERFESSSKRAIELRGQATALGEQLPGEQARADQGYINNANVEAANRLSRAYAAAGELGHQVAQTSDEIKKSIESGNLVMVTTEKLLQAQTAAYKEMQKRVANLESQMKYGTRPLQ